MNEGHHAPSESFDKHIPRMNGSCKTTACGRETQAVATPLKPLPCQRRKPSLTQAQTSSLKHQHPQPGAFELYLTSKAHGAYIKRGRSRVPSSSAMILIADVPSNCRVLIKALMLISSTSRSSNNKKNENDTKWQKLS